MVRDGVGLGLGLGFEVPPKSWAYHLKMAFTCIRVRFNFFGETGQRVQDKRVKS